MIYSVILHGSRATCPICAGTMYQTGGLMWRCLDCGKYFEAVEEGQTEGEMICKIAKKAQEEAIWH